MSVNTSCKIGQVEPKSEKNKKSKFYFEFSKMTIHDLWRMSDYKLLNKSLKYRLGKSSWKS